MGFVELTTGFLMNKPRTRVLDAPFKDGEVTWDRWGSREMSNFTSVIARISRLVVHPELRGLGVGTVLVREAQRYARLRFHADGMRPLFLEVTADMMKYVPFAERGGMVFVGYTEGNLHRVSRDLRYLLSDAVKTRPASMTDTARGIMSAQRRYARAFEMRQLDLADLDGALSRMNGAVPPELYERFRDVLRLPKPTYLAGLTPAARRFVTRRVRSLGIESPAPLQMPRVDRLDGPIQVREVSLVYQSSVPLSARTSAVAQAFGIELGNVKSRVLDSLSFDVVPGEITLVCGPSGSGKTSLLRLLSGSLSSARLLSGEVVLPPNARLGRFRPLGSTATIVETVASRADLNTALYALSVAGLSDAHLYLRRYRELSDGQKYRAMLAHLIASRANLWLADEFLSQLDPFTANVVASKISSHAREHGITVVVGAAHFDAFIGALQPDKVLRLSSDTGYELFAGLDFMDRLHIRSLSL
ncbi:MAG TPA: GNAT family N-acetyltransferase [Candidatus Limnocylindrales bacterium]|nr:GNAT family N-acetyltransferase [Candidatus Limnocylindrales bacterium]